MASFFSYESFIIVILTANISSSSSHILSDYDKELSPFDEHGDIGRGQPACHYWLPWKQCIHPVDDDAAQFNRPNVNWLQRKPTTDRLMSESGTA